MDDRTEFERTYGVRAVKEWYEGIRVYLDGVIRDLESNERRFDKAVAQQENLEDKGYVTPHDVISWTVNHLTGITPNLHLDRATGLAIRMYNAFKPKD